MDPLGRLKNMENGSKINLLEHCSEHDIGDHRGQFGVGRQVVGIQGNYREVYSLEFDIRKKIW